MFSKIIIATDFSEASDAMFECVHRLKKIGSEEILLLHFTGNSDEENTLLKNYRKDQQEIIERQISILKQLGLKVKSETVESSDYKLIAKIAEERNYSAVIVPSQGSSLSEDIVLGDIASNVIVRSKIPVFVVRIEPFFDNLVQKESYRLAAASKSLDDSLLFATDFSESSKNAFRYIEKFVECGVKSVTLFHVHDPDKTKNTTKNEIEIYDQIDKERLNILSDRLKKLSGDADISIVIKSGNPKQEIIKYCDEKPHSLIVMGSQGRSYIKELFIGSVSREVARSSNTSVLLIPMKKN